MAPSTVASFSRSQGFADANPWAAASDADVTPPASCARSSPRRASDPFGSTPAGPMSGMCPVPAFARRTQMTEFHGLPGSISFGFASPSPPCMRRARRRHIISFSGQFRIEHHRHCAAGVLAVAVRAVRMEIGARRCVVEMVRLSRQDSTVDGLPARRWRRGPRSTRPSGTVPTDAWFTDGGAPSAGGSQAAPDGMPGDRATHILWQRMHSARDVEAPLGGFSPLASVHAQSFIALRRARGQRPSRSSFQR